MYRGTGCDSKCTTLNLLTVLICGNYKVLSIQRSRFGVILRGGSRYGFAILIPLPLYIIAAAVVKEDRIAPVLPYQRTCLKRQGIGNRPGCCVIGVSGLSGCNNRSSRFQQRQDIS